MGGLIADSRLNKSEGLPLLSRIPFIGGLFGNQDLKNDRTELVLFITPRVVENELDMRRIIDDLRKRMENMDRFFPYISPFPALVFPPPRNPPEVVPPPNPPEVYPPRNPPVVVPPPNPPEAYPPMNPPVVYPPMNPSLGPQ